LVNSDGSVLTGSPVRRWTVKKTLLRVRSALARIRLYAARTESHLDRAAEHSVIVLGT